MEEAPARKWEDQDYNDYSIPPDNRRGFIAKVLGILTAQMFLTVALTAGVMAWPGANSWFEENWWIIFPFFAMVIIPEIILVCCMNSVARKVPTNYILLLILTLGMTGLVSIICSAYEPISVLIVAFLTAGITSVLAAFAVFTKWDFTKSLWIVAMCSCALSIVGISLLFVDVPRGIAVLIACGWILIYSIFIVIDIQMLAGGQKKYKFSEEDYIIGALFLYLDIIMLFLELLKVFGSKK